MNENTELFEQLVYGLQEVFGDILYSVILYGSVARRMQTEESDIDIAILLKNGQTREMHDKMTDLVVDLELNYNRVLSVLRIDYDKFKIWEDTMPFYKNVKKDGIILWMAA